MKTFAPLLCVVASALIMVAGAQAKGPKADHGCAPVNAVGVGQDLGGGITTATISHGGRLNGTTAGQFSIVGGAPPVLMIAGTVVFTTKGGMLTATVSGTFNVANGEFIATGPVSAGTGKFEGVTGVLTFQGVEDLGTGAFTETVTGTLCKAGDDD